MGKNPREIILTERKSLGNHYEDFSIELQLKKIPNFDGDRAEEPYFEALTAHKQGNHKKSIKLLKEVVTLYPENYKAWGNMGAPYFSSGDILEAIRYLQQSMAIKPGYVIAKKNLKEIKKLFCG